MTSVASLQVYERARARSFQRLRESCQKMIGREMEGAEDTERLPYGWCVDTARWRQMEDINGGPHLPNVRQPLSIPAKTVVAVVSEITDISPGRIMGKSRQYPVVLARWFVMAAMQEFLGFPVTQIGRRMDLDHTTVINGLFRLEGILAREPRQARVWDRICESLGRFA